MGIPRYTPWIIKKFNGVKSKGVPANVSSLALDMNTIVHNAAGIACGYNDRLSESERRARQQKAKRMSSKALMKDIIDLIKEEIVRIVDKLRPKHYLIVAFDGVPPRAKMEQQRSRRYGGSGSQSPLFDNTSITPGTNFMEEVEVELTRWFKENANVICRNIRYSGHMEPGEGEHKIFDLYRDGYVENEIGESELVKGAHLIYGLDADIINIALLSPLKNIHMVRPELTDTLNIDNLRDDIIYRLKHLKNPIETYIAATCFLGNDFLPNLPTFEVLEPSADALFNALSNLQESFLTDDARNINYDILRDFFKSLIQPEVAMLSEMISNKRPSRMVDAAKVIISTQFEEHDRFKIDFDKFRSAWYTNALSPRDSRVIDILGLEDNMIEDMEEMGQRYISGMLWIVAYYKGLEMDNNWFYPLYHAPLALDLAHCAAKSLIDDDYKDEILGSLKHTFNLGEHFTPLHQMIAVIPRSSWRVFPYILQTQVIFVSNYAELFPVSFITEADGKDTDPKFAHMQLSILPRIDDRKIMGIVENMGINMEPWMPREHETYTAQLFIGHDTISKILAPDHLRYNLSTPDNTSNSVHVYDSTKNTTRKPDNVNRSKFKPLELPESRRGELDAAVPVIMPIRESVLDDKNLDAELELALNINREKKGRGARGGRGRGNRGRGGRGGRGD